ncbi:MAG TPA: zinc-ribbon domain-containing protein [Pyrinomonadaceae bacterium]|nr:zinc-ribbon domain-containing protein [Pyrinomonadaceae bacterium]
MAEPEIFRRCSFCGASIRDNAFFCPQCGLQLRRGNEDETAALHDTQDIARDVTLTEADFQARLPIEPKSPPVTPPPPVQVAPPPEVPTAKPAKRAKVEVGARIQRATDKARGVEENVGKRVQKFREISSVVIDEAGYDPSLRFVLVAVILFILFVLIVLLNKFIG